MTETEIGAGTTALGDHADEHGREHDPWAGIPAELLDAARSYGTDTPGGCG
ncbi:hypothetical protein [Actinomadura sp. CNU-125]|uniref:hypothetical protein n=1 Tax=Actinomadura sp. CNU-125 TaxID=1904961 RepID=UPI00130182CE|nr:hypothetical protein [Actinomadura sp. CNU-125]